MTPPYQLQFGGDASTQALYQDLLAAGETEAGLDNGVSSVSYSAVQRGSSQGSGDRRINSAELFERISGGSHAAAYRRFAGESLPWQSSGSATSNAVLRRFDASVATWRSEHPNGTNRALAEYIFHWVSSSSGLNLHIVENEVERNIDEVFSSQRGDCTESTKVLLNLLTRAGFSPYPVWVKLDSAGNEANHIATGLDIGGRTFLLDPVYGHFNEAHRQHVRLSLREFLAWHWNNRALDLRTSSPSTALDLFRRAQQIDPNNPHILLNRAFVRRDNLSDPTGAQADFRAALAIDSSFHAARFELGNMEYDARRYTEAAVIFRTLVTAQPQNSSYRRNLVLALAYQGRSDEAANHFRALCRLQPNAADLPRLARLLGVPLPART